MERAFFARAVVLMKDNISHFLPYKVENRDSQSRFIILCDHASNFIPKEYNNLGLSEKERQMHIAWDPGSLAVGKMISRKFNATLIYSTISRLVIDKNRSYDKKDLIPTISEYVEIKANANLSPQERQRRIDKYHKPYHNIIGEIIDERIAKNIDNIIISIHSFTPIYKGVKRPWPIGLISGEDEKFSKALFKVLKQNNEQMLVGWNEPYSAKDGVRYTVDIHADKRSLHGAMVEIRNDEISDEAGVRYWAELLSKAMERAASQIG